jgi:hypothetical protein
MAFPLYLNVYTHAHTTGMQMFTCTDVHKGVLKIICSKQKLNWINNLSPVLKHIYKDKEIGRCALLTGVP